MGPAAQILMMQAAQVRDSFLTWQCQVRKNAMRQDGGRPSLGMRPRVTTGGGREITASITVLIVQREPAPLADMLRHTLRKTFDPKQQYEAGLKILSAEYYQDPTAFSGILTALFPSSSATAAALAAGGDCILHFRQDERMYQIHCTVSMLDEESSPYQLTYWHNRLFNPNPPTDTRVLAFFPDWGQSIAG